MYTNKKMFTSPSKEKSYLNFSQKFCKYKQNKNNQKILNLVQKQK